MLPDGAHHPFAKTMLSHFDKLNTSIKSVSTYPTIRAQNDRFTQLGWFDVEVETLWSAWSSEKYLSLDERQRLNGIEPFDEWEEFAIFGSHYCVVTARSMAPQAQAELPYTGNVAQQTAEMPRLETEVVFGEGTKSCQRRFAAPMKLNNQLGQEFVANVFGLGNTSRLRSLDLYGPNTADLELKPIGPSSRMCHSIVDLGEHGNILIGGRGSPSAPIKDCWIFDKSHKIWEKKEDLPTPLYRQAAVRLGQSSLALIIGGKTGPLSVSDRCLLYVPEFGWTECEVEGQRHIPVSGAIMVSTDSTPPRSSVVFEGILVGGLLEDGTIAKQTLRWQLSASDLKKPSIKFIPMVVNIKGSELRSPLLDRFGANVVMNRAGQLVVIGGIVRNNLLESQAEVLLVDVSQDNLTIISGGGLNVGSAPRPLLLGISVTRDKNDQILLTGGGATCFSMGTYWNKGHYSLRLKTPVDQGFSTTSAWSLKQTLEFTDAPVRQRNKSAGNNAEQPVVISIPRIRLDAASIFLEVLKAGKPVVIEKASLGSCVKTWSPEHLAERVGKDRKVVVHEAITAKMDFSSKNFNYVTKEFKPFLEEVQRGAKMYLRSLSEDGPADKPAMLGHDFPSLAEEFILPPELSFVTENTFSSILRITGPVNMWLHYDVGFFVS